MSSETTAATLVYVLYELCRSPIHIEKLRKEIDATGTLAELNHDRVKDMKHLNGVINEALRLHPVVPSGVYRDTPPEGMTIAGRYIPGNVVVLVPQYTLGRRT